MSDILRNILLFLAFLFFSQMMSSKVFAETAHYSWFCSPLNDYYLEAKPDNNVSSEWVGSRIDKELKFNLIMEISIIEVDKKNLNKLPVNFRVYQKGLQFRSIENGFKSLGVTQNIDAKPIKDKNWTHLFYKFGYQPFADDWSFNSLSGDLSSSSLFLKRTSEGLIGSLITNFDFNSLPVLSQNEILTQVFHFKCNNKAAFRVL